MSDHPDWLSVGSPVEIIRSLGQSRIPPRSAIVERQTKTLIILNTGERFKKDTWRPETYVLTPAYRDYRTILAVPIQK